jgi:hypothetical protein
MHASGHYHLSSYKYDDSYCRSTALQIHCKTLSDTSSDSMEEELNRANHAYYSSGESSEEEDDAMVHSIVATMGTLCAQFKDGEHNFKMYNRTIGRNMLICSSIGMSLKKHTGWSLNHSIYWSIHYEKI